MSTLDALLATCGLSDVNFSGAPVAPVPPTPVVSVPSYSPRLVLNMIVKNESRIIERLIRSVLPIIDSYCISDTGSTDDTREIIRRVMAEAGKPGEVYDEPFQNFGYNRTHALERAAAWGNYALLIDADMKLVIAPEFKKSDLVLDGYAIEQRAHNLVYSNTRFVRLGKGVTCVGPTHEYYNFPSGLVSGSLSSIWIEDIGDGGSKANKFTRDVQLLSTALITAPNNERHHFYLAQSYKDIGDVDNAIYHYKRRVEIGGWVEEVFYSLLQLGHLYMKKGLEEKAIFTWFEAYDRHPVRSESLYEICKHYRIQGKQRLAYAVYKIGSAIPFPKDDVLFIANEVYSALWYYEYSVIAYYLKTPVNHRKYLETAYSCGYTQNMLSNLKFYAVQLNGVQGAKVHTFNETVEKAVGGRTASMISSSPSLLRNDDGTYLMNVRYVSYRIRDDGSYNMGNDEGKITTMQKRVTLDSDLQIIASSWIDRVHNDTLRYQGVEDVKVHRNGGELEFLGTVENPSNGNVTVGHGVYSGDTLLPTVCESPTGSACEKNWVDMGLGNGNLVYSWKPLRTGKLEGNKFVFGKTVNEVPECFRDVRGSSNGVRVGYDLWFIVHIVSHENPRWYYHMLVVLDAITFTVKRHSILFKFTPSRIEYSLGLSVEAERICITYSTNDASSHIVCVPRAVVEAVLFA